MPEIISKCENLKRLDQDISFEVVSKLVSEAVKWTINLWETFYQSCRSYSESQRNSFFQDFKQKNIVNYVKMGQILLLMEPVKTILGDELNEITRVHFARLLRTVEDESLYSGIERAIRKQGEFWDGQCKRDLTNAGRSIPEPILKDRINEAKSALEHIHLLKILVKMRAEASMLKDSYWKEAFLFQDFLFEMNIGLYKELERIINSLGIITKNAATMVGRVGEEYGLTVK